MDHSFAGKAEDHMSEFISIVNHPLKLRVFLFRNLPAAYFSGVRVQSATAEKTIVTVPYKWFTRNPFRSTYFACLSMAAEMSTGLLAMGNVYKRKPGVSLLVVDVQGQFHKKATGITRFICEEGATIRQVVEEAISTRESKTARIYSPGYNEKNELVAEFWITWSFKSRQ